MAGVYRFSSKYKSLYQFKKVHNHCPDGSGKVELDGREAVDNAPPSKLAGQT